MLVENFNGICYEGRAYFNAPDIDGKVIFTGVGDFGAGDTVRVRVTGDKDYDLFGEIN